MINKFLYGDSALKCCCRPVNFTGFSTYESKSDSSLLRAANIQPSCIYFSSSLNSFVCQLRTSLSSVSPSLPLTWASLVAQMVKNLPTKQETWDWSLGREDLLEKGWLPIPVFLPGGFHGRRSPAGPMCPWGHKESDTIVTNSRPVTTNMSWSWGYLYVLSSNFWDVITGLTKNWGPSENSPCSWKWIAGTTFIVITTALFHICVYLYPFKALSHEWGRQWRFHFHFLVSKIKSHKVKWAPHCHWWTWTQIFCLRPKHF